MKTVTVILPTKNEPYADVIQHQLIENLTTLGYPHEIIRTSATTIAEAVFNALQKSKGDIIGIMDSSGTHKVKDLMAMLTILEQTKNVKLVVGTRIQNHYPPHRRLITKILTFATKIFVKTSCSDPLTALIIGKKEAMHYATFQGCKFGLEILARTNPNSILEYGYVHAQREGHKSKMKPQEAFFLLKQIWRLHNGK